MEEKHLTVYDLLAMSEKERQQVVDAAFAASQNEDFEIFEANDFYEEIGLKREITPHKGGRTAQLHVLVEPWVKEWIQAQGVSVGDWITRHAEAEREAKAQQDARLHDANG